jgi:hypothetical protein
MDGFLDPSKGGRTELRIHGVSGTPPESILDYPHPREVAGDAVSGFYRRWWPAGPPAAADGDVEGLCRREAYSWGGLTSGGASRALWLLLLPFMMLNFAFYMTPRSATAEQDGTAKRWRRASQAVQRLFALTLTASLVLSAVGVAMDLLGWQCGRLGGSCARQHGWLSFLTWNWLDEPGRQLAVTSLLPAAVVGLLWYLGHSTWAKHERTPVPARPGDERAAQEVLLENRQTWNGGGPVGRLRVAHVVAAFSIVSMLLLAPLARDSWLARTALAVHLVVITAVVVTVTLGAEFARREEPGAPSRRSGDRWRRRSWPVDRVALGGACLYAVSVVLAFFTHLDPTRRGRGALPWFTGTVVWTFVVQGLLLLALLLLTLAVGNATLRQERDGERPPLAWVPTPGRDGQAPLGGWGLAGLGTPAVVLLAWLVAGGFGAGLALRAAGFLGTPIATPGQPGQHGGALVVPPPYFWMAALAMVLLVTAVGAGIVVLLRWRRYRTQGYQLLMRELHGDSAAPEAVTVAERSFRARLRSVAGTWARARLTDEAGPMVGWSLAITAVLLVAGFVAYGWLGSAWLPEHASWLVTAGSFAVGAMTLWLIGVGRNAYRSPGLRRTVGILWDVGTFWPRAVHPLGPPCYTERVIPDLLDRVAYLAPHDGDLVVISAHSQGTIIAAALMLQLDREQRRRVRLLTYGSPLQRVYSRHFPAYFGPVALRRIGQLLGAEDAARGGGDDQVAPAATGAGWRWRNLFRPSDPIGGAVFYAYRISADDNRDVDWQLMDPLIDHPAGDPAWPRAYGHSDYWLDPAFPTARELLERWPGEPEAPVVTGKVDLGAE